MKIGKILKTVAVTGFVIGSLGLLGYKLNQAFPEVLDLSHSYNKRQIEQLKPEKFEFSSKDFPIGLWSPPKATDDQYKRYKEAGFNVVISDRFQPFERSFDLAEKHNLRVLVETYTPDNKPLGGVMKEEGRIREGTTYEDGCHRATLPELIWLHEKYGKRKSLVGYLLGDDINSNMPTGQLKDTTQWLKKNAPNMMPWICTNDRNLGEYLHKIENPIFHYQNYPTLGDLRKINRTNIKTLMNTLDNNNAELARQCKTYNLTPWVIVNISDWEGNVYSDSALRYEALSSIGYGAQSVWYIMPDTPVNLVGGTRDKELSIISDINHQISRWQKNLQGRIMDSRIVFGNDVALSRLVKPEQAPDYQDSLYVAVDRRVSGKNKDFSSRDVEVMVDGRAYKINDLKAGDAALIYKGKVIR